MITIENIGHEVSRYESESLAKIEAFLDCAITLAASDGRGGASAPLENYSAGVRELVKSRLIPKFEAAGYKMEFQHVTGYHSTLFVWWNV